MQQDLARDPASRADTSGAVGRLPSISRSLQLVAVALMLLVTGLITLRAVDMRRVLIQDASSQVARLNMVFAEQTGRAIETIDFLMRAIAEQSLASPATLTADAIQRRIAEVRQVLAIDVTDAAGRVVVSSRDPAGSLLPQAGLSLLSGAGTGAAFGLQISAPVRDGDGRWTAMMIRRLPGDANPGFVVGFINLVYFQDFYKAVDLSENGAILLHRRDGTVLARYPADDAVVGSSYAALPPFRDVLSHGMAGTVEMRSPVDGTNRILAIRALKAFPFAVNVSVDEDMVLAHWRRQAVWLGLSVLAAALLVTALLLLLARRTRDVERLLGSTRLAHAEAEAANRNLLVQMEERARAETALRQAQRVEAVGQLTGGVAHDFNNLLTVILGNLELLQSNPAASPFATRLATIRSAAERGATLTGQMLAFARRQPLMPRTIDLNTLVAGMMPLLQSAVGSHVTIQLALNASVGLARVDPTQVELVILNLAINARDAMPEGGRLTLETRLEVLADDQRPDAPPAGDYICLGVTDTGTGMTEAVLTRVFEPFFTTKGPTGGSGLGLSQAYGVARQSGGTVNIRSSPGEGTTVSVYLPRAPAETIDAPRPPAPTVPPQMARSDRPIRLLVVDDDADVLATTAMLLRRRGFDVLDTANPRDALDLLAAQPEIDLLLTDLVMPEINGPELARRARAMRPGLPIVFFSGYADPGALAGPLTTIRLLRKPFRPAELCAIITMTLDEAEAVPAAG